MIHVMNCREIAALMDSDAVPHQSWITRVQFRVHLWVCWHCRLLARQIKWLGKVTRQSGGKSRGLPRLHPDRLKTDRAPADMGSGERHRHVARPHGKPGAARPSGEGRLARRFVATPRPGRRTAAVRAAARVSLLSLGRRGWQSDGRRARTRAYPRRDPSGREAVELAGRRPRVRLGG